MIRVIKLSDQVELKVIYDPDLIDLYCLKLVVRDIWNKARLNQALFSNLKTYLTNK